MYYVQKEEISVPREMQRGRFSKKFFDKNIAAFQLVGYSAWNGEGAGSNPACYTKQYWAVIFPPDGGRKTFPMLLCSDLIGGYPL